MSVTDWLGLDYCRWGSTLGSPPASLAPDGTGHKVHFLLLTLLASCLYPNWPACVVADVAPRAPGTSPLLVTMTVVIPEASTQPGPGHPSSKLESIGELGLKRKKSAEASSITHLRSLFSSSSPPAPSPSSSLSRTSRYVTPLKTFGVGDKGVCAIGRRSAARALYDPTLQPLCIVLEA